MFCMKPGDPDTTGTPESHARRSVAHSISPVPGTILLNVNLADGTQRPVFLSNLTTRVAHGVLTATGTVKVPGQGRDTFTAVVRSDDTSDTSVALMLDLGSLRPEPLCLVTDVSHLMDGQPGAGRGANYVATLLTQLLAGADP
jgi:hypothetical protein